MKQQPGQVQDGPTTAQVSLGKYKVHVDIPSMWGRIRATAFTKKQISGEKG